jgi:hypothetical protein
MAATAATTRPALLTDVVLRAEADGSTERANRCILVAHSGVFREALAADVAAPSDTLPLPGKTGADVALLMGYLYPADAHSEHFTLQNISTVCALAREYDMPGMMEVAETWMVTAADMLGKPLSSAAAVMRLGPMNTSRRKGEILERVRLLRLGDTYNLHRFASASAKQLCKLECRDLVL